MKGGRERRRKEGREGVRKEGRKENISHVISLYQAYSLCCFSLYSSAAFLISIRF